MNELDELREFLSHAEALLIDTEATYDEASRQVQEAHDLLAYLLTVQSHTRANHSEAFTLVEDTKSRIAKLERRAA